MKQLYKFILFLLLFPEIAVAGNNLVITASEMTSLKNCSLSTDKTLITGATDGSSVCLGDSIDFGNEKLYNNITLEFSLTNVKAYPEVYGIRTGELDVYIDGLTIPIASVRKHTPVKWDYFYTISKRFFSLTGKHTVKIVWDWYVANLKSVTFSYDASVIPQTREIKIACLGNSITEGTEAGDRVNNGYVGLLEQMLGDNYNVRNYGSSGATVCRNTYNSFSTGNFCKSALSFQPDIVTICLGTNDTQPFIWNADSFALNFEKDYNYLVSLFENTESHPRIYLCLPPPIFPSSRWGHQPGILANEIIPVINKIAKEKKLEVIDFYSALIDHNEYYDPNDQLHPIAKGHVEMAKLLYDILAGK